MNIDAKILNGTTQVQGYDDGYVVLCDRHRQLPHQRHCSHLGHGNAALDGLGCTRCALLAFRRVHLLDYETVGAGYASMLIMLGISFG